MIRNLVLPGIGRSNTTRIARTYLEEGSYQVTSGLCVMMLEKRPLMPLEAGDSFYTNGDIEIVAIVDTHIKRSKVDWEAYTKRVLSWSVIMGDTVRNKLIKVAPLIKKWRLRPSSMAILVGCSREMISRVKR